MKKSNTLVFATSEGKLPSTELLDGISKGLKYEEFEAVSSLFGISEEQMGQALEISSATLSRRRLSKRFNNQESDRIIQAAQLWFEASNTFQSEETTRRWFKDAIPYGLKSKSPIRFLKTQTERTEVLKILNAINEGLPC